MTVKIKCKRCGKKAKKKSIKALYCSPNCRQRAYEERKGIVNPFDISNYVSLKKYKKLKKKYKKLKLATAS